MDPVDATRRLFEGLAQRRPAPLALGFQGTAPPIGGIQLLEAVMKRNLVFASWQAEDGTTGTWVLAWNREGLLLSLTEL